MTSVSLNNVQPGKKNNEILIVQKALSSEVGLDYSGGPGTFGPRTKSAYAKWQRKLGYSGSDADGAPGKTSLSALGRKHGFSVRSGGVAPSTGGGKPSSPVLLNNGSPGPKGYAYGTPNSSYAAGFHTGEDFPAPTGTRLVAVRAGTVTFFWGGAYGNVAKLSADNGRDYWYCHMSRNGKGGKVSARDVVGYVGTTGNSTGPHCHFEDRPRGGGYGQVRNPSW